MTRSVIKYDIRNTDSWQEFETWGFITLLWVITLFAAVLRSNIDGFYLDGIIAFAFVIVGVVSAMCTILSAMDLTSSFRSCAR